MEMNLSRSLLCVILPGWVAVFPWILALAQMYPEMAYMYDGFEHLCHAVIISLVIIFGTIFQSVAGYIEPKWDARLESDFQVEKNWYLYLSRTFENEPAGYDYIKRTVVSMKYGLGMMCALPFTIFGFSSLIYYKMASATYVTFLLAAVLSFTCVFFFYRQAKDDHTEINNVRSKLSQYLKD